jgi:hypothetical protein
LSVCGRVNVVVGFEEGSDDRKQAGVPLLVKGAELVIVPKRRS